MASLRCLLTREPFHICWNYTKAALHACGLFWVVLLARIVFNMPYGPWDGQAWWNTLVDTAEDLVMQLLWDGRIWQECYPRNCKDYGITPTWAREHMAKRLQFVWKEGLKRKEERMAMSRWFGFVKCASVHLKLWHSRLLVILFMGMSLGLYSSESEFPLWAGPTASKIAPGEPEEDTYQQEGEAVSEMIDTTKAGSSRDPPQPADGAIASGDLDTQALHKKFKHQLLMVWGHPGPRGIVIVFESCLFGSSSCVARAWS